MVSSINNRIVPLAILSTLLLVTTLACSIGTLTIGRTSTTIDITLKQDEINRLINNVVIKTDSSRDRLLDTVTGVEMHNGFLRILGMANGPGGKTVDGSYDVSISAENDKLIVKIVAVNIPGIELNDPRIVQTNQKIADELSKSVAESKGDVLYKSATVEEGVLKMTIQVNYRTR